MLRAIEMACLWMVEWFWGSETGGSKMISSVLSIYEASSYGLNRDLRDV